jgi:ComF family protein
MILRPIINALFPPRCLGCNAILRAGGAACAACLANVPHHRTLFCGRCRSRLPDGRKICHPAFPYRLGAAADYDTALVRALIHGLKFERIREAAIPLAECLNAYADELPLPRVNLIAVPIPLGRRRERERGFNQAGLIGAAFAAHRRCPLLDDVLIRTRDTDPQSARERLEDRWGNVRGCFTVARPEPIAKRTVVLIDDVTTSGATFFEAATVLKRAGARSVIALAVAKA